MSSILTITTPAASSALTTLANLKAELKIADTDTSRDAYLTGAIAAASAAIATYCDRVFGVQSASLLVRFYDYGWGYSGKPRQLKPLLLPVLPVLSVDSVVVDNTAAASGTWEVDPARGLLWALQDDGRCAWIGSKFQIGFTSGYILPGQTGLTLPGGAAVPASAALPADIERACISVATAWATAQGRDPYLKSQEQPQLGTQTYWVGTRPGMEGQFTQEVAAMLDPFRQWF